MKRVEVKMKNGERRSFVEVTAYVDVGPSFYIFHRRSQTTFDWSDIQMVEVTEHE